MSNFFSGDFFEVAYGVGMVKSGGMRVLSFLDKLTVAPYIRPYFIQCGAFRHVLDIA